MQRRPLTFLSKVYVRERGRREGRGRIFPFHDNKTLLVIKTNLFFKVVSFYLRSWLANRPLSQGKKEGRKVHVGLLLLKGSRFERQPNLLLHIFYCVIREVELMGTV
jgi:hypothetical protein